MTTDYKTSSGTAAVETVRLELRYSPGCKSAWAMISSSARVSTGLEFWVYNVMTGNEEVGMFGTQFQRTTMTDDQDAASHACTYVYNSSFNEQKICTTYF